MRTTHVSGDDHPHRGITMHEMPVGGSFPGLLFAVGSALIFLFAIPALWFVVAAAAVVGLVIAALLAIFHDHHHNEAERLTIKI
jgi:membrane protein YdbS with pleckstrin-like domain